MASRKWNIRYFGLLTLVAIYSLLFGLPVLVGVLLRIAPLSFLENVSRLWARMILRSGSIGVDFQGYERLPDPPAVLVGNHLSLFDILALIAYLPRPPVFAAKKELFRIPLFGQCLRALGHIPIDRHNREKAIASIQAGTRNLAKTQQNVVFFPEGTRSTSGELMPFKKGAFVFAIDAKLPVVPFAIQGSFEICPPFTWCQYPGLIKVRILEPIDAGFWGPEERDELTQTARYRIEQALVAPIWGDSDSESASSHEATDLSVD